MGIDSICRCVCPNVCINVGGFIIRNIVMWILCHSFWIVEYNNIGILNISRKKQNNFLWTVKSSESHICPHPPPPPNPFEAHALWMSGSQWLLIPTYLIHLHINPNTPRLPPPVLIPAYTAVQISPQNWGWSVQFASYVPVLGLHRDSLTPTPAPHTYTRHPWHRDVSF